MGFLRRVCGATLRDKVRSCEIRKALNVNPLLRTAISQLRWFGKRVLNIPQERLSRQVLLATHARGIGPELVKKYHVTWQHLRSCLVLSWCGAQKLSGISGDREVLRVLMGCCLRQPLERKSKDSARNKKWQNTRLRWAVAPLTQINKIFMKKRKQCFPEWYLLHYLCSVYIVTSCLSKFIAFPTE